MVVELSKGKEEPVNISFEFLGRVPSLSQNISSSGVVCRTSRQIDEMTILDIRFELPQTQNYIDPESWVKCSGIVVNCEKKGNDTATLPYEVAIFFDYMSEKDRARLSDFISNRT